MVADVIQMAGWKPRHAVIFPVVVFNAWVEFNNTVSKAWFDAFLHPYR